MKEDIQIGIELPKEVTAEQSSDSIIVKGPKGTVTKNFTHPKVKVLVEGNKINLSVLKGTKREKAVIKSFEAHINNIVKGVQEPHFYKIKICSGHFPMNVTVNNNELIIKNFLGESVPRRITLHPEAKVNVNGTEIEITSSDKEIAGQTAARIESLCRITNRDRRIFQDGCYIIHKAGKDI